jgi:hypothetical protein
MNLAEEAGQIAASVRRAYVPGGWLEHTSNIWSVSCHYRVTATAWDKLGKAGKTIG